MVAREGIEPPTRGFSVRVSNSDNKLDGNGFSFEYCGIFWALTFP